MSNGRIIVAGSINMDVVTQVERHPKAGETVKGNDLDYIPGGKGSNQAVAAARLGSQVDVVGKVGDDSFGQQLLDFLEDEVPFVSEGHFERYKKKVREIGCVIVGRRTYDEMPHLDNLGVDLFNSSKVRVSGVEFLGAGHCSSRDVDGVRV